MERERLAGDIARKGLPREGLERNGERVVNLPGDTVIMRAYTFTNYAGRFLYVEAHNKQTTATSGPTMRMSYAGADGVFRAAVSMSNSSSGTNPNNNGLLPDGNDCSVATGQNTTCSAAGQQGNKLTDVGHYMYHRQLQPLLGADANLTASQITVRVAAVAADGTDASFDVATPIEWAGSALPPRVANFQKDFITKYLDPTEIYGRMDQLTTQFPDIMEAIPLPHKTEGYQRPGDGDDGGHAHGISPTSNPNAADTRRAPGGAAVLEGDGPLGRQQHHRRVQGSARRHPNSPLSITVTDGTWRLMTPPTRTPADGISRDHGPSQGHRGQPGHRRHRRDDHHGRRRSSPRSTPMRPRARS